MAIAFGSLLVVVAGIVFCSRRGDPVTQDTVAWTGTAIVLHYALFFWPAGSAAWPVIAQPAT